MLPNEVRFLSIRKQDIKTPLITQIKTKLKKKVAVLNTEITQGIQNYIFPQFSIRMEIPGGG